jgi:putative ABC transport system ATP-binding protein
VSAPPDDDVLRARGLHYAYDGSPALQGVSLDVRAGEIVAVTGPRGSGKTTLLLCLSGQLTPQSGDVWWGDVPLHGLRRGVRERLRRDRFGWIGSTPQLVPELTAYENAALPLLLGGAGQRAARRTVREWLDRLDVGDCADERPAALLQAQRQRVAVARALAHSPTVVFADEPAAVLHQSERAQVLRTLTAAARSHHITVVLTTHEPGVTLPRVTPDDHYGPVALGPLLADRALTLVDGRLDGCAAADALEAAERSGDVDGDVDGAGGAGGPEDAEGSEGAACSLSV